MLNPRDLPIHRIASDLVTAMRRHQVIIVEGPTGCGKTTQIPQILIQSGVVPPDLIVGVTQPRRIAAVSVARRIAKERGVELGTEVGYAIRFDYQTSSRTRIKVMTDGILLQEARTDPELRQYSVIMVDEAHERSLNIDFTLGLLHELLRRRPEMRVIVSSATIYPDIFVRFFDGAPILSVNARVFPVETRWQPLIDDTRVGRVLGVADVIERIHLRESEGDVLVFLSGEADIKAIMGELDRRRLKNLVVVPLYGRLTREEQEDVFGSFPGRRKVVLATNIAETSITINGVRFVVDQGLAKVAGFDHRTGIGTLREMPVSQASARQRAGRAGRTGPGVCIRLYDRRNFHERPAFETEEVLRMDLSEVVLRLLDLGIREVEQFPFVTAPPRRSLVGAVRTLQTLGAIDAQRRLTATGRKMVPFPLAPHLSRMIVEAADAFPKVLDEVLTVGALLSVRGPQVQPPGEEEIARAAHRRFTHPLGDLVASVHMVRAYEAAADRVEFCKAAYLDPDLMAEIVNVRDQLADIATQHGVVGSRGGAAEDIVRCVATSLTRNICRLSRPGGQYETATGVPVAIHPSSVLRDRRERYVIAAEIVATERAWLRTVSVIEPGWIADIDPELAQRWRIRAGPVRKERTAVAPEAPPTSVSLGGTSYEVRFRRGRPTVDLPYAELVHIAETTTPSLVRDGLEVRVEQNDDRFLEGWPFAMAMRAAPHLRLNEPELHGWPDGDLFEADRDIQGLLHWVPELLRVVRSPAGRRPGFLTFVTNGAGGYWFECRAAFDDAVAQSYAGLRELGSEAVLSAEDREEVDAAAARLDAIADALSGDGRAR